MPVIEAGRMADKDSLVKADVVLVALQPGKGMGVPKLGKL